jgi:translation initiation factor 1
VSESRLVYSTALGRVRQPEERPEPLRGRETENPSGAPRDGVVRLFRERAGRGGKVVTVVRGLPGNAAQLLALAADLRRLCGAGGTVKAGVLEIQGDHRERIAEWLRAQGHTVKLAGG